MNTGRTEDRRDERDPIRQGEGYNGKFKCLEKKKIIKIHEILKRAEISRFKKNRMLDVIF